MIINTTGLLDLINSMIENHETVCDIPEEEQVWLDETDGQIKPYRWKKIEYCHQANSPQLIHFSMFTFLGEILGIKTKKDAINYLNKYCSKKKKGK